MHKVKYIGPDTIAVFAEFGVLEKNKTVVVSNKEFNYLMDSQFVVEVKTEKPKPKPKVISKPKRTVKPKVEEKSPETIPIENGKDEDKSESK